MIEELELKAVHNVLSHAFRCNPLADAPDVALEDLWHLPIGDGSQIVPVTVLCIREQGNQAASVHTLGALIRTKPRFAFLVGIAGGMKMAVGEVVIPSEVVHFGYSKITTVEENEEEKKIKAVHFLPELRSVYKAKVLRALRNIYDQPHPSDLRRNAAIQVKREKILSWDYVLDSPEHKEKLLKQFDRQLAAVEMEGAGFLYAVDYYEKYMMGRGIGNQNSVSAAIIRGISDLAANKETSDRDPIHRTTAAENAAEVLVKILKNMSASDFRIDADERKAAE